MTARSFQPLSTTRILDSAELTSQRISELGGYLRKSGRQWVIQCPHPQHPDINPSATLTLGDRGQAILHCFSCSDSNSRHWLEAVNQRLSEGIPFIEARPRGKSALGGAPDGQLTAEYAYYDNNGRKFVKARYEAELKKKSFEWFRDVNGARVSGLGRLPISELLPYGSEILGECDQQVLWVEGEKDVNRAREAGVRAVTSGGGASGPLPMSLDCLKGRKVIVVADNDPPGHRYALRVRDALTGIANDVQIALPAVEDSGSDLSDHLDAGWTIEDLRQAPEQSQVLEETNELEPGDDRRRLVLTRASSIQVRPVTWLWESRVAEGSLSLLAGREGQGKSTVAAWIVAAVTQGTLPGVHLGKPKSVFISASEDSWESTVVPRLMAAGADLDRVYRVEVVTTLGTHADLSMPVDIPEVASMALNSDVALLVLDPLMSRIANNLDTHRDAEVRQALEPLSLFADETKVTVIGLAHFNKSASNDVLNAVMASKAFTAVARSVQTVVRDGDDEKLRYLATAKNNLGRDDLPMKTFTIEGHCIPTSTVDIWTSRVVWGEEVNESVRDVMARVTDPTDRTAVQEASDWLEDYLVTQGGNASSKDIKKVGRAAGHSISALQRAKSKLGLQVEYHGFPRESIWVNPAVESGANDPPVDSRPQDPGTTGTTGTTGRVESSGNTGDDPSNGKPRSLTQSSQSSQKGPETGTSHVAEPTLVCKACGESMVEDFFEDGLHATCSLG